MVEMEQGELLASLRGYLEELMESGVDELDYIEIAPASASVEAALPADVAEPPPAVAAPVLPPPDASAKIKVTGNAAARLLFVRTGEFAAPSRELLAKMIRAMGYPMKEICVVTVPLEEGAAALRDAVAARIASVAPEVVVALGESAARFLMRSSAPIEKLRGRFVEMDGFQLMATLHPDQLVADEGLKRQVWEELKQVMARLGKG